MKEKLPFGAFYIGIPIGTPKVQGSLLPNKDSADAGASLHAEGLCSRDTTRVTNPKREKKTYFFEYLAASAAKYCLKPSGEKAGIGLRRESVRFPESKKLKPRFL